MYRTRREECRAGKQKHRTRKEEYQLRKEESEEVRRGVQDRKRKRRMGRRGVQDRKRKRRMGRRGYRTGRMIQRPSSIILSPDLSVVGRGPIYPPGWIGSLLLRDQIPIPVNRVVAPGGLHLLSRTGSADRVEKFFCRPGSCQLPSMNRICSLGIRGIPPSSCIVAPSSPGRTVIVPVETKGSGIASRFAGGYKEVKYAVQGYWKIPYGK